MYQCPFCNKSYEFTKSYTMHIRRSEKGNFSNELELVQHLCDIFYGKDTTLALVSQYKEEQLCMFDLSKEYSYVVQLISLLGLKRTHSQEKLTQRYKNKYISTIKRKYGDGYTNVSQITSVREKINSTLTKKYGSVDEYYEHQREFMKKGYNAFCSDQSKLQKRQQNIETSLYLKYGVINASQIPEVRQKISSARKREIAQMTVDERRLRTQKAREAVNYESTLEVRVKKCLVELNEDFISHQFLWGYNFDVMIKGKILIEVNGDFWHANPSMYEANDVLLGELTAEKIWSKDKRKVDKATSEGYIVITLWENDIKKLTDEDLTDFVKEHIQNARNY